MQAHVTAASQSFRLRERMEEANIRHGQEVRADIENVRVLAAAGRHGEIYFCNMRPIKVRELLASGDHGALPANVVLDGLEFPEPGTYDISNAVISANGDIRVAADERTAVHARARSVTRLFRNSVSTM
jgi:hypothetical protein